MPNPPLVNPPVTQRQRLASIPKRIMKSLKAILTRQSNAKLPAHNPESGKRRTTAPEHRSLAKAASAPRDPPTPPTLQLRRHTPFEPTAEDRCVFFNLPPELRNGIYGLVIAADQERYLKSLTNVIRVRTDRLPHCLRHPLRQVNRQIRREFTPLWLAGLHLEIDYTNEEIGRKLFRALDDLVFRITTEFFLKCLSVNLSIILDPQGNRFHTAGGNIVYGDGNIRDTFTVRAFCTYRDKQQV